jgi:hypothetical protein
MSGDRTALPGFLEALFEPPAPTWAQQACTHVLAAKMPDGKFFCPSCRMVSARPLVRK